MKDYLVRDLMVPLSEYATITENATLYDAVLALEKAQELFQDKHARYRHRAILVLDNLGKVIGKLSLFEVLMSLESKYQDMSDDKGMHRYGFSKNFMQSMLKEYNLFAKPLEELCCEVAQKNVKEYMFTPTEGEYVSEDSSLEHAIHQLVLGRLQSLLVTRGDEIVGVLRLTDVFATIFHTMKSCFK